MCGPQELGFEQAERPLCLLLPSHAIDDCIMCVVGDDASEPTFSSSDCVLKGGDISVCEGEGNDGSAIVWGKPVNQYGCACGERGCGGMWWEANAWFDSKRLYLTLCPSSDKESDKGLLPDL